MDVFAALESRSSTRGYTAQPLMREQLTALVRAGLQAPTATNRQEIHITVLDGKDPILAEIEAEKNKALDAPPAHNFYYEAPTVLILSGETDFRWTAVDAGIAVENIALAAEGLGLGSVIIGCIKNAMLGEKQACFAKALRFPAGYSFQIAIAVGRKAVQKQPHTWDEAAAVTWLCAEA